MRGTPGGRAWLLLGPLLLACLSGLVACDAAAGIHGVGVRTMVLQPSPWEPAQQVELWYPTATLGSGTIYEGRFVGQAVRDAPWPSDPLHPLVVVSHGMADTRFGLSWLAERLAAEGAIVAAIDHFGSDAATYTLAGAPRVWLRSDALSRLIDVMLQGELGASLDARRIAAVGFSMGGSTVLILGGAEYDPASFPGCFPGSGAAPEPTWRDPRVRAVVAIAPGTSCIFQPAGIARTVVPALIVSGEADPIAPEASNAGYYAQNIVGSQWHSVPDAVHFTFLPRCTPKERVMRYKLCSKPLGVDRAAVHAQVARWTLAFLRENLQ